MSDPAGLRRDYGFAELDDAPARVGWFELLQAWFDQAVRSQTVVEPNAIQLATVDAGGRPSVRTVLVKALDEQGIVFYTNYRSAKAVDLAQNPYAAAVFAWLPLERQVRLSGPVERVTRAETEAYFSSRPRGSQVAAWASAQSSVIASRASLEADVRAVDDRFAGVEVPAPPDWGGYRLRPDVVEFWQGRHDRLHDRLRHRRVDGDWVIERLAP
ncbi:MAG TPA: pyridoxamine 5'-phosphate oxidase [Jatrophihabitantaceae bacterium]|nr:pyridoxamine 5'-phosphate oxidase [Jatrophihabitantaceae bacterium]